ncbi:MAG: BrnT family toxin [Phycisphaerae bacterium]
MAVTFEWDQEKAQASLQKHGVSFEEAATVFFSPLSITIPDPDHSDPDEDRFVTVGLSTRLRTLVVVHCDRSGRIGLISARVATGRERKDYEEGSQT